MSTLDWRDAGAVLHKMQEEPGDAPAETRPVHGLPAGLAAAIVATAATAGSILSAVATAAGQATGNATLASILSALGAALTVNLPTGASTAANQATGNGSLASIATNTTGASTAANQTTSNTKLDTLHTDLGTTLHTDLATTLAGKLDTLHTDIAPATTVYSGNKNVTTAGTSVALGSQAITKEVRIRAKDANTGLIYVNGVTVVAVGAAGSGGDRLAPAEATVIACHNLSDITLDCAVNGEGVTYSAC